MTRCGRWPKGRRPAAHRAILFAIRGGGLAAIALFRRDVRPPEGILTTRRQNACREFSTAVECRGGKEADDVRGGVAAAAGGGRAVGPATRPRGRLQPADGLFPGRE